MGQIQYPDWYYQSSVPQNQQSQHPQQQTYTIGGGQSQSGGFFPNNANQSRPQSPDITQGQQVPSFAAQQGNPNQQSQGGFNQSNLGQSVHEPNRPQQVQSTYQIGGGSNNQIPPSTSGFNAQGTFNQEASYHQPQGRPQSPGGVIYNPQTGQYVSVDNFNGFRNGIQELHQETQAIRQNANNDYTGQPENFHILQQRLQAAEDKARAYEREMGRWKMEASRRGEYPGILDLLDETEKIRVETIKLLKLKETGKLGGKYQFNQGNRGHAEYE